MKGNEITSNDREYSATNRKRTFVPCSDGDFLSRLESGLAEARTASEKFEKDCRISEKTLSRIIRSKF